MATPAGNRPPDRGRVGWDNAVSRNLSGSWPAFGARRGARGTGNRPGRVSYEVVEAIDSGEPAALAEELGDLLLQIVFQAQIASEGNLFSIDDVVTSIVEKLIRRHPHVFGDVVVDGAAGVVQNWEIIKKREKGGRRRFLFEGIPPGLPALLKASRVQGRAAGVGFDWPRIEPVLDKLREEVAELGEAVSGGSKEEMAAEIGDVLFAAVNAARHAGVEAEDCLNGAVARFGRRFRHIEESLEARGKTPAEATLEEMDALWDEAKAKE
jgi:tetrapyrrole methylase family protein/MazG family protein